MVAIKQPNPARYIVAELWKQKKRNEQSLQDIQQELSNLKTEVTKWARPQR